MNLVIISGNLGKDVRLSYTPSQVAVANFSIATTEKYKDEKKTEWHNIVVFGKVAEICSQFLKKGSKVLIEGKIQSRSWDDKEGNKKYITEIVANKVEFMDKASAADKSFQPKIEEPKTEVKQQPMFTDSDIPF